MSTESQSQSKSTRASKAMKAIEALVESLEFTPQPALTIKQRKAATRSRKGMEKVIPTLANLSAEHGVVVPKQPTAQMTASLAEVAELEPVLLRLVGVVTLLEDKLDANRSGAWTTASTLYRMLKGVAYCDAQVTSQLAPVKEYFAYRTNATKAKRAALAAAKAAAAKVASKGAAAAPASAGSTNAAPSAETLHEP